MRKTLLFVLLTCFVLAATNVMAADVKIGYIDLQKAINSSVAGQSAKEQINKKFQTYEGEVDSRKAELQKAKEDLEKQALLLSDDARASKERDYQSKVKDFQRFAKDIQDELQSIDSDLTRKILGEVVKVARDLGEKEKYTVILEKSESSLVYADPGIDLTDRVIKLYDASKK